MPSESWLLQQPAHYRIAVMGYLEHPGDGFEGLTLCCKNGQTLIDGTMADQAALFGLLKRLRNMGMPLLSVSLMDTGNDKTDKGV